MSIAPAKRRTFLDATGQLPLLYRGLVLKVVSGPVLWRSTSSSTDREHRWVFMASFARVTNDK
jgi:hypothetical protein